MKVILGKCKGGDVEIVDCFSMDYERWNIYIYIYIYIYSFKGTFNLQIFFVLFCKSLKGKCFSFGYEGIIGYPTLDFSFFLILYILFFLFLLKFFLLQFLVSPFFLNFFLHVLFLFLYSIIFFPLFFKNCANVLFLYHFLGFVRHIEWIIVNKYMQAWREKFNL
jgi:hypothetical protein